MESYESEILFECERNLVRYQISRKMPSCGGYSVKVKNAAVKRSKIAEERMSFSAFPFR